LFDLFRAHSRVTDIPRSAAPFFIGLTTLLYDFSYRDK
jgi:hypothetical protein